MEFGHFYANTTAEALAKARDNPTWYAQTGVKQSRTLGRWQQQRAQTYAAYDYTKAIADSGAT